jgi:Cell wall-active antibiotics response 4TMS YvqF
VGALKIVIPRSTQAQIRVSSGLGQVSVSGDYRRDGDVYTSSEFENANNRVALEVKGGVGRISVEPSER